jgi:TonB family protein
MNFPPRLRRNQPEETFFGLTRTPDNSADLVAPEPVTDVDQIAKKLAVFAGKDVAQDLALDLMLNEAVEQARQATGATGGAIALIRDGEMVCRATTGKNAPDLGVRVDMTSGLPGASLITGKVQQCSDTEQGGLVNAEVCRRLGVRSMLIAPLVNGSGAFGILQVFSSEPRVFGEHDIETIEILAKKIAENKVSVTTNSAPEPERPLTESPSAESNSSASQSTASTSTVLERLRALEEAEENSGAADGWLAGSQYGVNAVLFISVVVAALALGLLIGWHGAAKGARGGSQGNSAPTTALQRVPQSRQPVAAGSRSTTSRPPASAEPPSGGLTVTENGKVIYRAPSDAAQSPADAEPQTPVTRLIHRVEPEYPEAAAAQHIEGPVVLDVQVLTDGKVGNIKILSGNPLLTEAAVKAVRQWQYQPFTGAGEGGSSQMQVTVRFSLPASPGPAR